MPSFPIACFRAVLARLEPGRLLRDRLAAAPALDNFDHVALFAFGKAAGPMLNAWLDAHASSLPRASVEAWLSAPAGAPGLAPGWMAFPGLAVHVFAGGHPQPNQESLRAGAAMLAAARRLAVSPRPALLVALISGGGSALVEVPVQGGLHALQSRNRALVASGAAIGEINIVRKHLSLFKGGHLAAAAGSQVTQFSWVLSDVPGDDLAPVASGPTCPDPSTAADCQAALARWLPRAPAPPAIETPKPGDPAFARSHWHRLADNRDACHCLAALARAAGFDPVVVDSGADEWECSAAAAYLVARWRRLRAQHPRPCLIAGGEVRVQLPPGASGRGGRNQMLALQVAVALEGEPYCFLSAGTDGVDGSSDAAGACVDGGTLLRARAAGFDPARHLRRFDAHPLLDAAGALIRTGPTGNNLRDLRMFLPQPDGESHAVHPAR